MYERFKCPYFGFFNDPNNITKQYNTFLNEYITSVKENPHSVYFPTWLAITMSNFQSVEDIRQIYDLFSSEIKDSYFGKIINNYINLFSSKFENLNLPSWNTGLLEPIVIDSTKMNLVLFSASWCGPCHEMIPLIKEIYTDLKSKITITYISIDEPEYVMNWKKIMLKEEIPWRSLLAADDLTTVKKKYYIQSIPYALLIYPNGKLETIDVRKTKDKENLYKSAFYSNY
jgi:thiol-disulfide isomerase/thioredoxin